jgi:hypothetical protein
LTQDSAVALQDAEQRLGWLRELAASLESARNAVLRFDLTELIVQTARERDLCALLLRPTEQPSGPAGERWNRLLQQSQQLAVQIDSLNREYGFLLAHARRTVNTFCRLLESSQATYLPTEPQPAAQRPSSEV